MDNYVRRAGGRATEGRLLSRPALFAGASGERATRSPRSGAAGGGWLYVPAGHTAARPAPLAVMLHGAGGNAEHGLSLLREFADERGMILSAPASRAATWDVIVGGYGADVETIDRALAELFSSYPIDPARVCIGGFSDGASYALSLGLTNGDLFTHVVAFSPGFAAPAAQRGRPQVYISHGTRDRVLPIDRCSRRVVPELRRAGYDVTYREFDGEHVIPPEIKREAVRFFVEPESAAAPES